MRQVPPVVSAALVIAAALLVATVAMRRVSPPAPEPSTSLGGAVVTPAEAPARADHRRALDRIRRSDSYLGVMLAEQDSVLRRWPDRMSRPLRIYIPSHSDVPDWRPGMREAARSAFGRWERVADVPMRFEFVSDSSSAEVVVHWIPAFAERRTGQADIVWNHEGWIVRGRLTLAVHNPGGGPLPDDAVHTVALHEIGHLLGLGHSDQPADVMFPTTDVHDLTLRDRATAQLLYSVPPGTYRLGER